MEDVRSRPDGTHLCCGMLIVCHQFGDALAGATLPMVAKRRDKLENLVLQRRW